jgi:hypothetical protein
MDKWHELAPEQPDGMGVIKHVVCAYCRNGLKHGCIEECAPEGLYRNLEPMALGMKYPPKLPIMAALMKYALVTRLAMMYLVLHYVVSIED